MKMAVFYATFLHYEGWIGLGTAWANDVKLLWNLPQSSIQPLTFYADSRKQNDVRLRERERERERERDGNFVPFDGQYSLT